MRNAILNIKDAKRIAIMGGTFNPIHNGHLVTAEAVRNEYNIDRVIFIPTGKPPHKPAYTVTHSEHRYLMSVLATYNNPYFEVSRIEIDREGISYTIDTIRQIRERCREDAKIYFITGADAVHQILTWKDSEELLSLCSFIAVTRPGYNSDKLYRQVLEIKSQNKSKIHFLEVPSLAISSSDIRNRILIGKPIKYLLPEEVETYILKFNLYTDSGKGKGSFGMSRKNIEKKLKKALPDKRYIHTQGVVEEAIKLADCYSADKGKILIAALLHDCAKGCTVNESIKLCKAYGCDLSEVFSKWPAIVHAFLGAEIAKNEYKVTDKDILSAIKYHTTGKADMSVIEKIVYIADCIEPNRDAYPGIENVRKLAYVNLDKALIAALNNTINETKLRGELVHPLSYEALQYLESKGEND